MTPARKPPQIPVTLEPDMLRWLLALVEAARISGPEQEERQRRIVGKLLLAAEKYDVEL